MQLIQLTQNLKPLIKSTTLILQIRKWRTNSHTNTTTTEPTRKINKFITREIKVLKLFG